VGFVHQFDEPFTANGDENDTSVSIWSSTNGCHPFTAAYQPDFAKILTTVQAGDDGIILVRLNDFNFAFNDDEKLFGNVSFFDNRLS